MKELSLLEQRRIQAEILVPFIRSLESEIGKEEAHRIVKAFIDDMAFSKGRELGSQMSGTPVEKFAAILPTFSEDNALEIEILDQSPETFEFNVTRCRFVDLYEELGAKDLGFMLSCSRDFPLARGISEQLKLERKQTIMEGDRYCDFRFRLLSGDADPQEQG